MSKHSWIGLSAVAALALVSAGCPGGSASIDSGSVFAIARYRLR